MFKIDQKTLYEGLKAVAPIVESANVIREMGMLRVGGDGAGVISVTGVDGMGIAKRLLRGVEHGAEAFAFLVNAEAFVKAVGKLPACELSISLARESDGAIKQVKIRYGRNTIRFNALDGSNAPMFAIAEESLPEDSAVFEMSLQRLLVLLDRTSYPIEGKPVNLNACFQGVLFDPIVSEGSIRISSTNTHRLASMVEEVAYSCGGGVQGILPFKSVKKIGKILSASAKAGGEEGRITVVVTRTSFLFKEESTTVLVRAIAGQYPNLGMFFSGQERHEVRLSVRDVQDVLERVKAIAEDTHQSGVKIAFEEGDVVFRKIDGRGIGGSSTELVGSLEERFECAYEPEMEGRAFSVNHNYMIDMVGHIDSAEMSMSFAMKNESEIARILCRGVDEDAQRSWHILTPLIV